MDDDDGIGMFGGGTLIHFKRGFRIRHDYGERRQSALQRLLGVKPRRTLGVKPRKRKFRDWETANGGGAAGAPVDTGCRV